MDSPGERKPLVDVCTLWYQAYFEVGGNSYDAQLFVRTQQIPSQGASAD